LYDIYHMQIDEGDVIRTINDNHNYFGHYHTGGVPGRHEIDESQELFYPAIMKAILKTGFSDYVAQEFIPTGKDNDAKLAALKKAVHICDI
jgi:hydroxypyruvate isomerase